MILKVIRKFFEKYSYKNIIKRSSTRITPSGNIIKINGKIIKTEKNISNLQIINEKIFINGNELKGDFTDEKVINVSVYGFVEKIDIASCSELKVNGDINYLKSTSGELFIKGDVYTATTVSGNINCKTLTGNANTISGNISKRI